MTIKEEVGKSIAGWQYAFSHVQAKAGEASAVVRREVGETVTGYRYGASLVAGKVAKAGEVAKREAGETAIGLGYGASLVASKAGESFGNVTKAATSWKYPLYIGVGILAFIAIMTSIGYSGLGGPAARVAEQEYGRRR